MTHQRLMNECSLRLARFSLSVVAGCLREEERRDAFDEFARGFHDVLVWYEQERERIARRLSGRREVKHE